MIKRAAAVAFAVVAITGCGQKKVDYSARFDELTPIDWRLQTESGGIKQSGCNSTACGELDRVYKFDGDVASASKSIIYQLQANSCAVQRAGNGLSANCKDVYLAVSFASDKVTVAMTKP